MLRCPSLSLLWLVSRCIPVMTRKNQLHKIMSKHHSDSYQNIKKLLFVGCKDDESSLSTICEKSFNLSLHRLSWPVFSAYPCLVRIFWVINCFWFGLLPLLPVYFSFAHKIEFVMFCMSAYYWGRKYFEKMSQVGSRRCVADRIWNFYLALNLGMSGSALKKLRNSLLA